jgi:F-type H+-transporting ATPase subunit b
MAAFRTYLLGMVLAVALTAVDAQPALAAGMRKYWDIAWSLLNFGIVVYILYKLLKEPLVAFFGKKREEVEKRLADAEAQAEDAAKELAGVKDKTASLKEELDRITHALEERGETEREKIAKEGRDRAAQIVERAELEAQRRFREAAADLRDEVVEQALGMAADKLRELITPVDQEKLVKSYLEEISRLAG